MTKSAKKPGGQSIKVLWQDEPSVRIKIKRGTSSIRMPLYWIPRKPGQMGPSRPALYLEGL
ncbi:MAG: hypothetical protein AAB447_01315 [Patescibacteria group bacterium]